MLLLSEKIAGNLQMQVTY